jgi:hypothetical protein
MIQGKTDTSISSDRPTITIKKETLSDYGFLNYRQLEDSIFINPGSYHSAIERFQNSIRAYLSTTSSQNSNPGKVILSG